MCPLTREQNRKLHVGTIPWRWEWQPTPVFLPGESHGQRSLAWGLSESETTEWLTQTHTHNQQSSSFYRYLQVSSKQAIKRENFCIFSHEWYYITGIHIYITFKISSTLTQIYLLIISSYPIYYNGMLNWSMPIQVSFLLHIAASESLLTSDHVTWLLKILKSLPMLSEVKAITGLQKVLQAYIPHPPPPHPHISKLPISYHSLPCSSHTCLLSIPWTWYLSLYLQFSA